MGRKTREGLFVYVLLYVLARTRTVFLQLSAAVVREKKQTTPGLSVLSHCLNWNKFVVHTNSLTPAVV